MGVFQKVGAWFSDRSDRFIRGDAERDGYYTTREAREAYRGMGNEPDTNDAEEQTNARPDMDPFGHGEGEYGGRVPYRSKRDMEMDALREQQRAAQPTAQAMPQQPPAQPPMGTPQPAMNQQPMMGQQPAMSQQPMMGQQPTYAASNVVPFPGMQQGPDGMVYAHVEYIVLLRNRNECKNMIAYIKTSASVFLNMEFIASDSERQRCVDMLSGAAYTLGCALNKISPRGIYLISAPTVKVVMDPAIQKFSATQEAQGYARQPYEPPMGQQPYGGYAAQRPMANAYEQPMGQQTGAYAAQRPTADAYEQGTRQPRSGFAQESPTARFQAQGTQRNRPVSFASAMAGGYQDTGRQPAAEYIQ